MSCTDDTDNARSSDRFETEVLCMALISRDVFKRQCNVPAIRLDAERWKPRDGCKDEMPRDGPCVAIGF